MSISSGRWASHHRRALSPDPVPLRPRPRSLPFVVAIGALVTVTAGGLIAARRRERGALDVTDLAVRSSR